MTVNSVSGFLLTISFFFAFATSSVAQELHLSDFEKLDVHALSDSANTLIENGFTATITQGDKRLKNYWFTNKSTGNVLNVLVQNFEDGSKSVSISYHLLKESDYNGVLDFSKRKYTYDGVNKVYVYNTSTYSDQQFRLLGFVEHPEVAAYIFRYTTYFGKELSLPQVEEQMKIER